MTAVVSVPIATVTNVCSADMLVTVVFVSVAPCVVKYIAFLMDIAKNAEII